MGKDISGQKLDLFHGLSNELPRNIKESGVKSVVTIHDLIFLRYPHLYKRIDRIFYKNKFLAATRMADKIIAVSEQTRSDLISFFNTDPDKIAVIYQGCSSIFYERTSEEKKNYVREIYNLPDKYILYVGTIEERKNLLQLIMARHEFGIDIPLVVIGRATSYMNRIKKYLEEKSITDVCFLEQVSHSDLPPIYQMSSVFVYPSSFEGFGIPVLEALNSGVPVIAATGSCLEETGGSHSIYINPENSEEIASALIQVLSSEELRETMITEGYKYAMNFREEITVRKLMELYKKLII
jgi:glycosyltransferase involved in cell wall biosynthesis